MTRQATGTRKRLLDAACALMAQHGYHGTTHQEICRRAGANIASINYYFGSKEQLYEAVWERAYELAEASHGFREHPGLSPEEALRGEIRSRLEAVLDEGPGGWLPRIILRAVAEGGHTEWAHLFERYLRPRMEHLARILKALLGPDASDLDVRCCAFSIHSQCVHFNRMWASNRGPFSCRCSASADGQAVVSRLIEFMVGGVRHMRNQLERDKTR